MLLGRIWILATVAFSEQAMDPQELLCLPVSCPSVFLLTLC